MTRWTRVLFAVLVAAALVMAVSLIPVGYVIQDAGPTVNVLGSQGDTPVLEFSQSGDYTEHVVREKVPDDGQLRMVTVSSLGGPGTTVRVGDVVDLAWTIEPRERLPGLAFTTYFPFAWRRAL